MRMLNLVAIAVICILLSGCNVKPDEVKSFALNSTKVAAAVAVLNTSYPQVAAVVAAQEWTDEERARLQAVDGDVRELLRRVESLTAGGASNAIVSMQDLLLMRGDARDAYYAARLIVEPRLAELDGSERVMLQRFDRQAQTLGKALDALENLPDGSNATGVLLDVLSMAGAGVQVAKML